MTNKDFFKGVDNKFFGQTIIKDKEKELADVSKSALAHALDCELESKREITEERDTISKELDRTYEENENLRTIIKKLQNRITELKEAKNV